MSELFLAKVVNSTSKGVARSTSDHHHNLKNGEPHTPQRTNAVLSIPGDTSQTK